MDIVLQPANFNDQSKVNGQKEKIDGTNLEEALFTAGGEFCVGEPPHGVPISVGLQININDFLILKIQTL